MKLFFLALLIFSTLSTKAKSESFNCAQVSLERASECFNQKSQVTETSKLPNRFSAKELEGIKGKNLSEWPWGIGGEAPYLENDSEDTLVYEITNYSSFDRKVKTRSRDWTDLNRGDSYNGSAKIPIVRF